MRWERYNKMTKEQKEEYNFKFERGFPIFQWLVLGIIFMLVNMVSISLFIAADNTEGNFSENALKNIEVIIWRTLEFSYIMVYSFFIALLYCFIVGFTDLYREYKWLKERGL